MYTAEQMFRLLEALHGEKKDFLNINPRHWEDVSIVRKRKEIADNVFHTSYLVEVDGGDGSGWFVCQVWKIEAPSQDQFDGSYEVHEMFGFAQHDGDWGNAGGMLAQWYHAMCFHAAGPGLTVEISTPD
jgi:hypothetical protein